MHFSGTIAIGFLCIVGGIYSLYLLAACCFQRQTNSGNATAGSSNRFGTSKPRLQRWDWWCQAISAVAFLVVAASLLTVSWRRIESPIEDVRRNREPLLHSLEPIPGLPPAAASKIMRDRDRPNQPVVGADLAFLPITDTDILTLKDEWATIEYLVLTGTHISNQAAVSLQQMPRLSDLHLGRTRISNSGCRKLGRIRSLEVLNLADTEVSDEGLAHLSELANLTSLNLSNTNVTDTGLESLVQMHRLQTLFVQDTKVTPEGLRRFTKRMPGVICHPQPSN